MKGPLFVLLILILISEIIAAGAGAIKIFQLRSWKSQVLSAFGLVLMGVMIDRITTLVAQQYRPQLVTPPQLEYLAWLISGRVICAVCIVASVAFLLGLKNGKR